MDAIMVGHAWRRLICWLFDHDYVIKVPARSLVNIWCARCGEPFPTKL